MPNTIARRRFTADYKLRVLRAADAASRRGEVAALLRREGLYTSHLAAWRKQRDAAALEALERPRGPRPRDRELGVLRRRAERAEAELERAGRVIDAQRRVLAEARERALLHAAVDALAPLIGTRAACRALAVAPATVYRRRRSVNSRPP
jgi:transposase